MNIQKMMKQAQQMQAKMEEMQSKLEEEETEGSSGGGMVKVTMNGKGHLLTIALDDSLIDVEEKDMLEDLIVAAFNDGKDKVEKKMQEKMSEMAGNGCTT